ncbi:aspartyl protease family protein [Henriciella aquimarina]|uniref:aspartyl protease family protein n=1 Tax=Henriciella aquimarina TaxID=545261 RepID=UPI001301EE48|nr:aspartyl protease family protein [Henriciella aquimarina]
MKRTSLILALLAAAVMLVGPASANQQHTIPFEITQSGHLVIDVAVNGTSDEKAIVDTGATFPMLDRRTAERLGLTLEEGSPTVDIIGLGATSTFPVLQLDSLRVGDVDLGGVEVAYNSEFLLPGARNLIPSSSIPLRTLDFDFEKMRLRAYDRRPFAVRNATTSRFPITWINDLPFIEIEVNHKAGLALIDTGANVTFINSVFAENVASSPDDFRTLTLTGSTGEVTPIRVLSSRLLDLGDFRVKRFDVIVSDPEFFAVCGLKDQPVMVLGLDVLKSFRLQIDREANELRISRPLPRHRSQPGMTIISQ